MDINKIYQGDALEVLKSWTDECIDMVCTSPPYWNLRDYGVEGQLGLEPTFQEYISKLCDIFDEIKRVLKKEGNCFVNLGDTYNGNGNKEGKTDNKVSDYLKESTINLHKKKGELPEKCLLQIPSRFAIEMCERGWILRNRLIWWKRNAMPSSVTDRFGVDYEDVFFFVKNKKYYFDIDSVREPHGEDKRVSGLRRARELGYDGKGTYADWYFKHREGKDWANKKETGEYRTFGQALRGDVRQDRPDLIHPLGRAKRSVWDIITAGFSEAHFATFPEVLIEPMIKAGCPEGGIVCDPFGGAMTTCVVAKKLKRKYVAIELNPAYIEIGKRRLYAIPEPML